METLGLVDQLRSKFPLLSVRQTISEDLKHEHNESSKPVCTRACEIVLVSLFDVTKDLNHSLIVLLLKDEKLKNLDDAIRNTFKHHLLIL